jgi:hypothetical protein
MFVLQENETGDILVRVLQNFTFLLKNHYILSVEFEVLMAVSMKVAVFLAVVPCRLVG